jgi:hypothetical protein
VILEGIVTTINSDQSLNISPMGPIVDQSMDTLTLRPFRTSTTYQNLKRLGQGVFHVTDDVELLAQAAVGTVKPAPNTMKADSIEGFILTDACRWYAFQVDSLEDNDERTRIECSVIDRGRLRDFFGFNRAKHAVIEAAILVTRIHLLPPDQIRDEFERLDVLIQKTAGEQERRAFEFLKSFLQSATESAS